MDEMSAMKLSTDAVLLGSLIQVDHSNDYLDIGTGSGIVSLMMAQRSEAVIDAIDIDQNSIEEARLNFKKSKWASRLSAIHSSLQEFSKISLKQYDLIFSNPPFFSNSLKSPNVSRTLSKHNDQLGTLDLIKGVNQFLHLTGKFWLIVPFDAASSFKVLAKKEGLFNQQEFVIFPKNDKPANRIVMEFRKEEKAKVESDEVIIRNLDGSYTNQYKILTKEFYLNF